MKVLLVEDDSETAGHLIAGLAEFGIAVEWAANAEVAMPLARERRHDVLVVDRMMPGMDGLALIRTLREDGVRTPVLILSALADVDERVRGLRAGGDDYLTKPCVLAEMQARLEALHRRARDPAAPQTSLCIDGLELDVLAGTVTRDGRPVHLHPREFRLLEYFMRHAGQVVTRSMIMEAVWNYRFDPQTNVVDVHVSRLRQKIDKGFATPLIHTVRGAGYCLRVP